MRHPRFDARFNAQDNWNMASSRINFRGGNSSFGREERQKREGPAVIAGPSQSAVKFGVAFRSFGT